MLQLLDLAVHLVEPARVTDDHLVAAYVQFAKQLLDLATGPASHRWREHLDSEVRYDELLGALFAQYFEMLRRVGWHLKPELRPESWLEKPTLTLHCSSYSSIHPGHRSNPNGETPHTAAGAASHGPSGGGVGGGGAGVGEPELVVDAEHRCRWVTRPAVYTTAEFVGVRRDTLASEWQFAQQLLDRTLSKTQRSALAKVFSAGMLKLARDLLRDAALICEHHAGRSEYKTLCTIAPQVCGPWEHTVRSLAGRGAGRHLGCSGAQPAASSGQ